MHNSHTNQEHFDTQKNSVNLYLLIFCFIPNARQAGQRQLFCGKFLVVKIFAKWVSQSIPSPFCLFFV